jgi:hypothetical protein
MTEQYGFISSISAVPILNLLDAKDFIANQLQDDFIFFSVDFIYWYQH